MDHKYFQQLIFGWKPLILFPFFSSFIKCSNSCTLAHTTMSLTSWATSRDKNPKLFYMWCHASSWFPRFLWVLTLKYIDFSKLVLIKENKRWKWQTYMGKCKQFRLSHLKSNDRSNCGPHSTTDRTIFTLKNGYFLIPFQYKLKLCLHLQSLLFYTTLNWKKENQHDIIYSRSHFFRYSKSLLQQLVSQTFDYWNNICRFSIPLRCILVCESPYRDLLLCFRTFPHKP